MCNNQAYYTIIHTDTQDGFAKTARKSTFDYSLSTTAKSAIKNKGWMII